MKYESALQARMAKPIRQRRTEDSHMIYSLARGLSAALYADLPTCTEREREKERGEAQTGLLRPKGDYGTKCNYS